MAFTHYSPLTITDADVSGTPGAGFVALVMLTDNRLRSVSNGGNVAQTDGDDIAFYANDGTTQLPHDLVSYDPVTGAVVAWVRITCADGLVIRMYYGDGGLSAQSDQSGTWSGRVMMLSLNESAGGGAPQYTDRTGNGNHGTITGGVTTVTGKVGSGAEFNGSTGIVATDAEAALRTQGSLRASMWVKYVNIPGGESSVHIQRDDDAGNWGWKVQMQDSQVRFFTVTDGTQLVASDFVADDEDDTFHQFVFHFDRPGRTMRMYVDGAEDANSPNTSLPDNDMRAESSDAVYTIGAMLNSATPDRFAAIVVDEVILEHQIRSADFYATEYNNQNDPAGFWTLGTEQSVAGNTGSLAVAIPTIAAAGIRGIIGSGSL